MASADNVPDPIRIGYWLSSEEHRPADLVSNAIKAEAHGFTTAMISDHLHPWTPTQGNGSFVWTVLGAIAGQTSVLRVGTGVTGAGSRSHPLNIAQAAATVESLMPGRFFLGLGTGERLNEGVMGERWPRAGERRERVREAIELIRRLWAGGNVVHRGDWFNVENAQLFTRPDSPPDIMVAGTGATAEMAGALADGLIGVAADPAAVEAFEFAGGQGKAKLAQIHVCWAEDEAEARRTAHRWWPQIGLPPSIVSELATPEQFADASKLVTEQDVADAVVCGPDPQRHLDEIARFVGAGFTEVYVHQIGPDQPSFLDFYRDQVLSAFQ
jgi:coenzyme F420-dependent glucose-6-phosphate dehydrogenase